jgi:hypothetical protein
MKVRIDCTLDIDKKIIKTYIDDLGSEESIKEFIVTSIVTAGILSLDESLKNAIGEDHNIALVKWDLGAGVVMEPTRIELLEAWITIQKLMQTDPKLDEYHKQILPDVLSLLNHRQDKLKGRE